MNSHEYLYAHKTLWDYWDSTNLARGEFHFEYSAAGLDWYYPAVDIEECYPGFISAYELIKGVGCDEYYITSILKFCITNAMDENLCNFIVQSNILQLINYALELGLPCNELISVIDKTFTVATPAQLPASLV